MKQLSRIMVVGVALAILCTFVAIDCVGQWKEEAWQRIPEEVKTQIITRDYRGRQELSVMCFSGTGRVWGMFAQSTDISSFIFCDAYFSGSKFLIVAVTPGKTSQYWYPWQITFTQGLWQFDVGMWGNTFSRELLVSTMLSDRGYSPPHQLWDYVTFAGIFGGGSLKPGTVAWGAIRIPSGIDLTLPFKVWVSEDFGVIEAFYGIEDDPGEDE